MAPAERDGTLRPTAAGIDAPAVTPTAGPTAESAYRRWSHASDADTLSGWSAHLEHDTVVVFLHGNGLCSRAYEPFLSRLSHPVGTLLIDLPGHGENPPEAAFRGWHAVADRVLATCRHWHRALPGKRWVLVGHSFGAAVAFDLMDRAPEHFSAAVLLDPAWFPPAMLAATWPLERLNLLRFHALARKTRQATARWPDVSQTRTWLRGRSLYRGFDPGCLEAYLQYGFTADADGVRVRCPRDLEADVFCTMPYHHPRVLRRLTVPTTVFSGRNTDSWFRRAGEVWPRWSPQIQHAWVPGRHTFMLDDPAGAAASVSAALARAERQ